MKQGHFQSRQIYPAGSDGSVYVIEFLLPEEASVTLSIISEKGRDVERIVEQQRFAPGRHQIEFDSAKCRGNACFYRLAMQSGDREVVDTKMIYMQITED